MTENKYRVGIIGFGHMHVNHVAEVFSAHPRVEWVACADTVPVVPELREAPYTRTWNLRNNVEKWGIPRQYDDYRAMLEENTFDIVIVTTENAQHLPVVQACAEAGVRFCCVEKPMAASLSDALHMVRVCDAHGTGLIVNWPMIWNPALHKLKSLIDEGAIGRILEIKWRLGHTGPLGPGAAHAGVSEAADVLSGPERAATWWHQSKAGGGAMLDFCSYGCMLARWCIGEQAVAAMGMRANLDSQYGDGEDNAVIIARFPNAIGLFESSFTTWHHGVAPGPIVYGSTGTLVVERRGGGQIVRLERGGGDSAMYEPDPLPDGSCEVAGALIRHLETGDPLDQMLTVALNLDAMAILDAGVRSAASNTMELADNVAWCIG